MKKVEYRLLENFIRLDRFTFQHPFNNERVALAALSVGIGQAAFEYALNHAKEREAFSRPVGQFQTIQSYLDDAATELEMARLLTYKGA